MCIVLVAVTRFGKLFKFMIRDGIIEEKFVCLSSYFEVSSYDSFQIYRTQAYEQISIFILSHVLVPVNL